MAEPEPLRPDDIEKLLKQAPVAAGAAQLNLGEIDSLLSQAAAKAPTPTAVADGLPQGDMDLLLRKAEEALASVNQPSKPAAAPDARLYRLEEFGGAPPSTEEATLDLLRDVDLDVRIELGRTHMYLEEVLKLRKGSVVPLDKLAGDPVDIYVNDRLIARGEVLVLNDNFCVRVAQLISGETVEAK